MHHETINDQFKRYLKTVYTDTRTRPVPGSVQFVELRRCFYGAFASAIGKISEAADTLSEDEACQRLDRWLKESEGFAQSVKSHNI